MLYKNDEIFQLNTRPEEIKKIEKYFHGKFPVRVVYPPDRIVPSKLKHNKLPDKPNSISFDLRATVKTTTGTEIWRYAENIVTDNKGVKKYIPKKFLFDGRRSLDRNEIELIYFLLRKSPFCKGGDNEGKMTKFMFEDLVSEAEKKVEKRAIESKIDLLIFNKDMQLPEERLRLLLSSYGVDADDLMLPQVKILLNTKIHETKDGIDKFFDRVDADVELETRANLTKAIKRDLIFHDDSKRAWYWRTVEGKIELISKVPPSKSNMDALYDAFLGDQGFREDLQAALLTGKPGAGKAPKKKEEEVSQE